MNKTVFFAIATGIALTTRNYLQVEAAARAAESGGSDREIADALNDSQDDEFAVGVLH